MGKIGAWVLKQACKDAMRWPAHIRVAVNVSPAQFRRRALELDVITALEASGLPASRLEIEITESVLLEDSAASLATLERIHAIGVKIAMDDFGTGYSSLSYLQKFPFDKIKIDKSFINHSPDSTSGKPIIQAILALATSLGMSTTAEGVETEEQFQSLSAAGCSELQGYFFGKPMHLHESVRLTEQIKDKISVS
jgi:EAL domain-containing protein (putative c-di-GMP-specific phosphodiesterase class I)